MAKKKIKYSPDIKKGKSAKKDPMLIAACSIGAVILITVPILGKKLDFTDSGVTAEAPGWNSANGEIFYIDPQTNKKAVGVCTIDGKDYLFDNDGGVTPGWTTLEGNVVYVSKDGTLSKGICKIGDDIYCFSDTTFEMLTGFQTVEGNTYYFKDDGRAMKDFQSIDENNYYFDNSGVMQTGWFQIGNGKNYYAAEDGHLVKGWKILDDGTHYFTDDFSAASGEYAVDDTVYNFDEYGVPSDDYAETTTEAPTVTTVPVTSSVPAEVTTSAAQDIQLSKGWNTVGTKKKYVLDDGSCLKGPQMIDGKQYFFGEDGFTLPVGFTTLEDGSVYYTFDNGTVATGLIRIGTNDYLFDSSGRMQKGWQTTGSGKCYFENDGRMAHGFKIIDGYTYFLSWNDGSIQKGYISVKGERYYFDDNGIMQQGWIVMNGAKYYFAGDGRGVTGYQNIDGSRYYFGSDGMMLTGFHNINGKIYYFGEGPIYAGKYIYEDAEHSFDDNGMMTD